MDSDANLTDVEWYTFLEDLPGLNAKIPVQQQEPAGSVDLPNLQEWLGHNLLDTHDLDLDPGHQQGEHCPPPTYANGCDLQDPGPLGAGAYLGNSTLSAMIAILTSQMRDMQALLAQRTRKLEVMHDYLQKLQPWTMEITQVVSEIRAVRVGEASVQPSEK